MTYRPFESDIGEASEIDISVVLYLVIFREEV